MRCSSQPCRSFRPVAGATGRARSSFPRMAACLRMGSSDLRVNATAIDGLLVITMRQVTDERGTIREFYRASAFDGRTLPHLGPWQQLNVTESGHGAVRGLHGEAMTKLV